MLKKLGMMLVALVLPLVSGVATAEQFKEGVHYVSLPFPVKTSDESRVEVVEAFGYPCPHCNSFEPLIQNWEKKKADDVNFVRIPVVFGRSWEPFARAYYSSELMKTVEKTHVPTFNAVHVERRRFRNKEQLADFYGQLGVDKAKFSKMFDSFAVTMKLRQGDSKIRGYGVDGVPSMVVNGKYRITAQMAGSHQKMLEVVDFLVEKERKAAQ
ncbi:thiol:disulfide interchange protein DsbA/DsbL [Pontibacterium sp.]|uniref:thiol:disulfide interchange protein DsbA/DsbL n=1 Tax=Pontibacterium sp. TaxID=2036026 RepID=UPI003511A210